ncbi:MAG: extracellular solute-binding protein [Phycisphaeraceae bacterium]|nr:extracellular solute-binding protein [Phycisphaeraceae bacterium]MCW5762868.1 extracellular solute-binding protein [Phycisphaeraceae bacterium]
MRTSLVVLFGLAAGTAATILPGLVTDTGVRGGRAAAGRTPITMAVWGMPFEDRLFRDQYARGYERIAPVQVDYQRHPDIFAKYNAWHAKGEGIEVMRLGIDYYRQFVERRMLEPLTPYINDGRFGLPSLDRFPQRLIDELMVDGVLYALPEDNAMYGLYFNRTLFDEYNAANPDSPLTYPSEHWTWQDVRDAARKLTGPRRTLFGPSTSNPDAVIAGFDLEIWSWPFFNFFAQAGGQLWSEDQLTTYIDQQAGVDALLFLRDLIVDGSWRPSFGQEGGTGPTVFFPAGRVAMLYGGSWLVPKFENDNPNFDFVVVPVPRGRVPAVVTGAVLWGMSTNAKNKTAGWSMISWLVEDAQAEAYWDRLRVAPPANLNVLHSSAYRSTRGLESETRPGTYEIQPMPESKFEDRAAWTLYTWEIDEQIGRAPGWIATGLYQDKLQSEIHSLLQEYLRQPGTVGGGNGVDPQVVLRRAASAVHAHIDADRAAKGLPPAKR